MATDQWISAATAARLDNPEGRSELARLATAAALVMAPEVDIEIFWDHIWIRRIGADYFPVPEMFQIRQPNWWKWIHTAEFVLGNAGDFWFHLYKPHPGDVIVDIGAGRGEDLLAFSRAVGPTGSVIAIEPHPASFLALQKFCEYNHLDNVTPLRCACVAVPGELQIESLPMWESNYVRTGGPSDRSYPVAGVRFDDLCKEYGIERIDFLKMNIEGAERVALPGCAASLTRARFACVAAHDFRAARGEGEEFRTLAFVRQFLAESGFHLTTRDEDSRYYVPYHVHGTRSQ